MKFSLKKLPINRKLVLANFAISFIVVLTATIFYIANHIYFYHSSLVDSLISIGQVVETNSRAPLLFKDGSAAIETLESFSAVSSVRYAAVFDGKNEKFGEYGLLDQKGIELIQKDLLRGSSVIPEEFQSSQGWLAEAGHFAAGHDVSVRVPIIFQGERLGTLYIFAQTSRLIAQIKWFGFLAVMVLLVSMLLSSLLANNFFKMVSRPLVALAKSMRNVSKSGNYQVHDISHNDDEVGELVDGFRSMLEKIKRRDDELAEHRNKLEVAVVDRTKKLLSANQALEQAVVEIREARDEADEASRAKSEFLATMSHEIRTPMNGMLGMTQLLTRTSLDEQQKNYVGIAHNSGKVLLNIINDILDFSKIEAGKLEVESISFDLTELVEESVALFSEQAHSKGVELVCIAPDKLPTYLIGDSSRLRQILMNLISNAVKFTAQGEVVITAELNQINEEQIEVNLFVSDTGVGISKDSQKHIFDAFSQADSSTTRKYGGTGLGLAISRQLAQLMKGHLEFHSEEGNGSVFSIHLPLKLGRKLQAGSLDISSIHGSRIVVVDDNKANLLFLEKALGHWGVESHLFADAKEALAHLIESSRRGMFYDFAIIDMVMPGMDGVTLASQIKENSKLAELPLMLLSSAYYEVGRGSDSKLFDCTMMKPVRQDALLTNIVSVLGQAEGLPLWSERNERVVVDEETVDDVTQGIKVLVVEDDLTNQQVASAMLKELGMEATLASDGEEAIDLFGKQIFDVVLMDCQMSGKDGYQTTGEMREIELKNLLPMTPIVALTANAMSDDRQKCLAAGMTEYLSKPIDIEQLKKTLFEIVSGSASNGKYHPKAKPVGLPLEVVEQSDDIDAGNLLDQKILNTLKDICGDAESFDQILQVYLEDSSEKMVTLKAAGESADWATVSSIAHAMKSSSMNVGAMELGELFKVLEVDSTEGNTDKAGLLLASLQELYQKVVEQLRGQLTVSA